MNRLLLRIRARLRDALKPASEAAVGGATIALLRTTRYFDPDKTANFFGRAHANDRPPHAREPHRPRQPEGGLPGKISGGD